MKTPVAKKKRRFKPEERRAQIIEATKELILENGLAWASSLRIAKALGISQQALYHHFKNKREILLATLSSIINEIILRTTISPDKKDIEAYIHEAARMFHEMTIADPRQSRLMVEYLCAPPTENMREEVQGIFSSLLHVSEEIVREGMDQGLFQKDLNVRVIAWIFISFATAFSIGTMLEVPQSLSEEEALEAIDVILRAIKK